MDSGWILDMPNMWLEYIMGCSCYPRTAAESNERNPKALCDKRFSYVIPLAGRTHVKKTFLTAFNIQHHMYIPHPKE